MKKGQQTCRKQQRKQQKSGLEDHPRMTRLLITVIEIDFSNRTKGGADL